MGYHDQVMMPQTLPRQILCPLLFLPLCDHTLQLVFVVCLSVRHFLSFQLLEPMYAQVFSYLISSLETLFYCAVPHSNWKRA